MFTVALVGPDGAGKSTVSRRLERELPFPTRTIYMGVNLDSSGLMLPTTRLVLEVKRLRGRTPDLVAGGGQGARSQSGMKSTVRLVLWMAEEWFRQLVASYHTGRGTVVVFDRHFFADYYHDDVAATGRKSTARRLHGFVLRRLYPKPDLTICLDAPGELLYQRKGEASPEWLERRRREYLELEHELPAFEVVDASQEVEAVFRDVAGAVTRHYADCARGRRPLSTSEHPTTEGTR